MQEIDEIEECPCFNYYLHQFEWAERVTGRKSCRDSWRCSIWWTDWQMWLVSKSMVRTTIHMGGVDFKETYLRNLLLNTSGRDIESLFNFTDKAPSSSLLSSDPFWICFCSSGSEPDFALEQSIQIEDYPGQLFYVEAVAVGQYNGTTPGVVLARAVTSNTTSILKEVHLAQESKRSCTRLEYSISSISEFEVIQLVPAGVSRHFFYADINVTLLKCPLGFALENATSKCDCHPLLNENNVTCDITKVLPWEPPNVWSVPMSGSFFYFCLQLQDWLLCLYY